MTKHLLSYRLLVEFALFSSRNLSEQLLEMEDKCNIHCVNYKLLQSQLNPVLEKRTFF